MVDEASDKDAIVGQADLTEADLAQASAQLPGAKRPWLVPAIMAGAALLFFSLSPSQISSETTLTMLLPMAFVVLLAIFFQRLARRAWVKQAFANIGGPTTFRFDDYGFSSESSLRQHRLAWASLARSIDTPQAFLVYTTPRTVLIVPKRAFVEADVVSLRSMLAERVAPTPLPSGGLLGGSANRTLLLWVVLVVTFLAIWQFLDSGAPPKRHAGGRRHRAHAASVSAATEADAGETKDVDSSP